MPPRGFSPARRQRGAAVKIYIQNPVKSEEPPFLKAAVVLPKRGRAALYYPQTEHRLIFRTGTSYSTTFVYRP